MAKRDYNCACGGFHLKRGSKTRKQYAVAKLEHSAPFQVGNDTRGTGTCELLAAELKRSALVPKIKR